MDVYGWKMVENTTYMMSQRDTNLALRSPPSNPIEAQKRAETCGFLGVHIPSYPHLVNGLYPQLYMEYPHL